MPALATGGSAHPKISGLLALPISRSPCEKISEAFATSDQDGSSPRRAVRGDRGTAREFLQRSCDSAAPENVSGWQRGPGDAGPGFFAVEWAEPRAGWR